MNVKNSKNSVCVCVQAKFWRQSSNFEKLTPFANASYLLRSTHKPAKVDISSLTTSLRT